jgi:hypothetical protein
MTNAPQRWLTWKQATSYCETEVGLFEFCGWLPAYMEPAIPPFSLNAEPGADAAFPGSLGAVLLRQVCDGWPVPEGFPAANAGAAASASTVAGKSINFFISASPFVGPQKARPGFAVNKVIRSRQRIGFPWARGQGNTAIRRYLGEQTAPRDRRPVARVHFRRPVPPSVAV